jgi:hypothetical protein
MYIIYMPKAKNTPQAIQYYKAINRIKRWVVIDTRTDCAVVGAFSTPQLTEFVCNRVANLLNNNLPLDNFKAM